MVKWNRYDESLDEFDWDNQLLLSTDYTIFQSLAWGEYKRNANWDPVRYVAKNASGKLVGMVQLLIKKLPMKHTLLWSPGGPVFLFQYCKSENFCEYLRELISTIRLDYPRSLIRFHSHITHESNITYNINKVVSRPFCKLTSGYTIKFEISNFDIEAIRSKMASKHRYYAKKASEVGLTWKFGNSDEQLKDLLIVHQEMVASKQLGAISVNDEELSAMRDKLKNGVMVLNGYLDSLPVTSCLVLLFGEKAFYMIASTGKRGRDISAAYAMFEELMRNLSNLGVKQFDFGGIDPANPAAEGVNHFKRGFGGQLVEYVGEWELSSSKVIRYGVNLLFSLRGGRA